MNKLRDERVRADERERIAQEAREIHPSWEDQPREKLIEQIRWQAAVIRALSDRLDSLIREFAPAIREGGQR